MKADEKPNSLSIFKFVIPAIKLPKKKFFLKTKQIMVIGT